MKTLALPISLLCGCMSLFGYEVKMRVIDETGAPVRDANAVISFLGAVQGQSDERHGKTDEDGRYSAKSSSLLGVYAEAKKEGHYGARLFELPSKDHDLTVVLPRILNPIPLYATTTSMEKYSRGIKIPVQNEWLGFDLEAGDWVAPHGKGKVTDIRFKFRNQFKGYSSNGEVLAKTMERSKQIYAARKEEWTEEKFRIAAGKWDAELEISFPGEKEGMFEVAGNRFLPYSQMKMPHEAPANGYVPSWRYTVKTYSPPSTRENAGFFLRTRVKLDEKGNIISAHYSKVMGDFYLSAQGGIAFTYYFNPTPNERNLEFDPKRNLFPKDKPGANVFDP